MIFRNRLCISLCLSVLFASFAININAQTRSRIVPTRESQPVNTQVSTDKVKRSILSSPTTNANQRPTLTNQIAVVPSRPLVKNTVDTRPTNSLLNTANKRLIYTPNFNDRLMSSIQAKIGIPYLYGAEGPNRYDCSSFVWKVFQEAGISFTRTSARTFWNEFEPVY